MSSLIDVIILFGGNSTQAELDRAVQSVYGLGNIHLIQTGHTVPQLKNGVGEIHTIAFQGDFADLRNKAERYCKGSHVFFLDADEWISREFQEELRSLIMSHPSHAISMKRQDRFLGRWLLHGETASVQLVRVYPNKKQHEQAWKGSVHEYWSGGAAVQSMKHRLFHEPHKNITSFLTKIDHYTSIVPIETLLLTLLKLLMFPIGKFIWNVLILQGFKDGYPGFIMAYIMSLHSLIVRIKHLEQHFCHNKTHGISR